MKNIELVIKISEEYYNYIKKQVAKGIDNPLKVIIANGKPLGKPLLKGHWIEDRCDMYICSNCGHVYTDVSCEKLGMNYCPNCRADMSADNEWSDEE